MFGASQTSEVFRQLIISKAQFTLLNRHYIDLNNVRDSGVLVQGTPCTPEKLS